MESFVNYLVVGLCLKNPFFWIVMILAVVTTVFHKQISGFLGEFYVRQELFKLSKKEYIVLNNILLKSSNGTHQIDHIILSKFGIFVIETKNYNGLIVGNGYDATWCQYLGEDKYCFKNPLHQNYGHLKALSELLGLDDSKFISIVCISGKAKIRVKAKNVVNLNSLTHLIKTYTKEILDSDLDKIKSLLLSQNISDKSIKKEHIESVQKSIKVNQENENIMICPKCGGKLVKRSGKYGDFIGCSNYPKCRYTKQL